MPASSLAATGALKRRLSGRIGRQPLFAFSRSQLKVAVKGSRTRKPKRFSTVLAMPEALPGPAGVLTPLPYTSCIFVPGVRVRLHASVTRFKRSAAGSSPSALSIALRSWPETSRTATRSPKPSTAHQTLACTLASVAGPFRCSTKCWSSSTGWLWSGTMRCTNGPPVLNLKLDGPASSTPLTDRSPARSCTLQDTPGGRSSSRSKDQLRSLSQRPEPLVSWVSLQVRASGASALASPKMTALSSNLTTT